MKLNENILRGQELLELGNKLINDCQETNALGVIAGLVFIQKAAEFLKAEYVAEATEMAKAALDGGKKNSGSFMQNGISYSVSRTVNYEFVEKPQKYHDEDSTAYRTNYYERESYKEAAKACTDAMKGCRSKFIANHPNVDPESVDYSLSVQFAETAKFLGLKLPEPKKETVVVTLNSL